MITREATAADWIELELFLKEFIEKGIHFITKIFGNGNMEIKNLVGLLFA